MNRRAVLLGLAAAPLSACGLSTRAYVERHEWPLDAVRAGGTGGPRRGQGVLLIRSVRAGPAVTVRGLQTLQPDGSVNVAFYDEWLASPAELFEGALRRWLTDSGRFAAVTAPGARLDADLALDCELTALIADPASGTARCDAAILVTRAGRAVTQRAIAGRATLPPGPNPASAAHALDAAAADACGQIEAALG